MDVINLARSCAMHRWIRVHRASAITRHAIQTPRLEERLQMECGDKMSLPSCINQHVRASLIWKTPAGARRGAPMDNHQSVVLIFVTFVPSSDKSPIRPFSPKTKPRIGFPIVVASYWPPAPLDTTATAESPPADHPALLVK